MKILTICVAQPNRYEFDGKEFLTSIFKCPVEGPVAVRATNIDGDRQADLTVHGGRDKAIYVYSRDYYDDWAAELQVPTLQDAQFGENLTVSGGTDEQVVIGSRYRVGTVEVVVAQPRIPCSKLELRLNDASFPARFWAAGRLGLYLRVESEGSIEAGQSFQLLNEPEHGITVRKLYDTVTAGTADDALLALDVLECIDAGWVRRLHAVAKSRSE